MSRGCPVLTGAKGFGKALCALVLYTVGCRWTKTFALLKQSVLVDGFKSGTESISEVTCQLCRIPVEWVTLDKGSPSRESGVLAWRGSRMCKVHRGVSQHLSVALGSCLSTEQICSYGSHACYSYHCASDIIAAAAFCSRIPVCTGLFTVFFCR